MHIQNALEIKKNLVRTSSHEIRTPLNTVSLGLELLKKELQENHHISKEEIDILNDIKEACGIAIDLVTDTLVYEKLEEGQLLLEKSTVSVWRLLHEAARPFYLQVNWYII